METRFAEMYKYRDKTIFCSEVFTEGETEIKVLFDKKPKIGDNEVRYNHNHDSKTGRFAPGTGSSGSGGNKKKTKYAPSPRRNPKGITVSHKTYSILTGIMNTKYSNAKAEDRLLIRDSNYVYHVIADGYGGMTISKKTKIK